MIKIENTLEVISVGAALFLVNAISHNALRTELAASRTIYLEYFFILLYLTILTSSINGLANNLKLNWKILQIKDNFLAKVLFWPLYLGIAFGFTLMIFLTLMSKINLFRYDLFDFHKKRKLPNLLQLGGHEKSLGNG